MSHDVPGSPASDMSAIIVSRQYGSGGGELAARLSRRIGWQLVDHQLVAEVARRLGITEADAQARDERAAGLVSRVVNALLTMAPEGPVTPDQLPSDPDELYHHTVRHIIDDALRLHHVVIVGRGAQALLLDRRDVLRIRIVAPLEARVAYVALREGLPEPAARARIQLKERDRARYLQTHYHRHPDDPLLYDLTVNTGVIDLDSAVDLVLLALERKANQLNTPEEALGPGAGLGRYRGRPEDFQQARHAEQA